MTLYVRNKTACALKRDFRSKNRLLRLHVWFIWYNTQHFIVNSSINLLCFSVYALSVQHASKDYDFRSSDLNFLQTSCSLVWLLQLRFIYFILQWEGTCHIFLWNKNNSVCRQYSCMEERRRKAIVWQMMEVLFWSFLYTVISRTGFLKTRLN